MVVNEDECNAYGVDPKRVASIARRIERAAKEAQSMGIQVFGGSNGTLRGLCGAYETQLILADIYEGNWSGGDGATSVDDDGLIRGE